jgi:hypothetical protein
MAVINSKGKSIKGSECQDDSKTVRVVFVSLLLDLLAFTMILPLFPALLDHYHHIDKGNGLYSIIFNKVHKLSILLNAPDNVNTVLFGGMYRHCLFNVSIIL